MTRTKATHRFDDTISVSRATMRRLVLAAYQAGDPRPIAEVIADREAPDDSAKWSAWTYEQRKSDDGKPGVLLIVEED